MEKYTIHIDCIEYKKISNKQYTFIEYKWKHKIYKWKKCTVQVHIVVNRN